MNNHDPMTPETRDGLEESPATASEPDDALQPFRVVDRRHFLDWAKRPVEGKIEESPRYPSFVEELLARVKETERRFEERKQQMNHEIQRSRERIEADFQRSLEIERQKMLLPFLAILDDLQRALRAANRETNPPSLIEGIEMIAGQFELSLRAQGVEALELLNERYDPNLGQAVGVVQTEDPAMDGIVVEEVVRGFRMGEQLLRPAQVRVAQFRGENESGPAISG
jgi:molecular chaperone GrpE